MGLSLESGQEGGGVCGLWRGQRDACDLSGASLGWGRHRGEAGGGMESTAGSWTQPALCCRSPRNLVSLLAGKQAAHTCFRTVLRPNKVLNISGAHRG